LRPNSASRRRPFASAAHVCAERQVRAVLSDWMTSPRYPRRCDSSLMCRNRDAGDPAVDVERLPGDHLTHSGARSAVVVRSAFPVTVGRRAHRGGRRVRSACEVAEISRRWVRAIRSLPVRKQHGSVSQATLSRHPKLGPLRTIQPPGLSSGLSSRSGPRRRLRANPAGPHGVRPPMSRCAPGFPPYLQFAASMCGPTVGALS
jgi:hypothetical protein